MRKKLWVLFCVMFVALLSGCQPTPNYYQGAKADSKGVVWLAAPQTDKRDWQDVYVTVDYSFTQQGNQLDFAGTFFFSVSPVINYDRVRDFKLRLFLLDKNMLVVDSLEIATMQQGNLEERISFSKGLDLPDNIVAFTFGYSGLFFDDVGIGFNVWKLPKRNF